MHSVLHYHFIYFFFSVYSFYSTFLSVVFPATFSFFWRSVSVNVSLFYYILFICGFAYPVHLFFICSNIIIIFINFTVHLLNNKFLYFSLFHNLSFFLFYSARTFIIFLCVRLLNYFRDSLYFIILVSFFLFYSAPFLSLSLL